MANSHGRVSSIYLFVLEIIVHNSCKAFDIWYFSINSSTTFNLFAVNSSNSLSTSFNVPTYSGTLPSKYLLTIDTVLFTKFPKSLHNSELYLSTKSSGVYTPSCEIGTILNI